MKILISSGATREPIDEVRFITNFSSGNTGAFLADFLSEQGHQVTFLAGEGSQRPRTAREVIPYSSFADLDRSFRELLGKRPFEGIIHLAAVSDYSVNSVETSQGKFTPAELKKIESADEEIGLRLRRNFKIVSKLKQYAQPSNPTVVAFKLTDSASYQVQMAAITKLSAEPGVDFVVHNDLNDIKAEKANRYKIFEKDRVMRESLDRHLLAVELEELLRSRQ
ncbi:MAG: phosphopantothenoylcysteine decarboxylase [Bdellovibrionia bacterium]